MLRFVKKDSKVIKRCLIPGCWKQGFSKNMCRPHYMQAYFAFETRSHQDRGQKYFRRSSLVKAIHAVTGFNTQHKSPQIVNAILSFIITTLRRKEKVEIPGFGTFTVKPFRHKPFKVFFTPHEDLQKMLDNPDYKGA